MREFAGSIDLVEFQFYMLQLSGKVDPGTLKKLEHEFNLLDTEGTGVLKLVCKKFPGLVACCDLTSCFIHPG